MAFTPVSGVGGYVGTPRPKRPYTRSSKAPGPAGYATAVHTRIARGTQTPSVPQQQPAATPAAGPPAQARAPPQQQGTPPGLLAQNLMAYLNSSQDPNER